MWWQWSQITLLDSILFSFASIALLYVLGLGITKLISSLTKNPDPFGRFDVFQKITFRVLFGFAFVFFFILIFSFFGLSFLASTILVFAVALTGLIISRHDYNFRLPNKFTLKNHVRQLIVLFVLILATIILSDTIAGFYGSTNDDAAFHSLVTSILLQNPSSLITRATQPYANFLLVYPSGTHVLCAFLVTALCVSIQKIVIMVSIIVPILIALSFYSTIQCLFADKTLPIIGLAISAFFAIDIFWSPISWGGLPLLLSLYISVAGIGLIFVFFKKHKPTWITCFFGGLVFFIAAETYPDAFFILVLWSVLILAQTVLTNLAARRLKNSIGLLFTRNSVLAATAFVVPLLFSFPYFYTVLTHHFGMTQINDVNTNTIAIIVKPQISFNWLFDFPALFRFFSGYSLMLVLTPLALILGLGLLVFRFLRKNNLGVLSELTNPLLLVYCFMLLIFGYLTFTLYAPNFLPWLFLPTLLNAERVLLDVMIPAVVLTSVVIFFTAWLFFSAFRHAFFNKTRRIKSKVKISVLAGGILLIVVIGFFFTPIVNQQISQYQNITNNFKGYETLGPADLSLMQWIIQNIPPQAKILVSYGDSGQYVETITHRPTVSFYSYLANYSDLMTYLTADAHDLRAVPILIAYNVSYVYIGSIATNYALNNPQYRHFNSTQFLSVPYFTLVKQVGDAWLFQFNASEGLFMYDAAFSPTSIA